MLARSNSVSSRPLTHFSIFPLVFAPGRLCALRAIQLSVRGGLQVQLSGSLPRCAYSSSRQLLRCKKLFEICRSLCEILCQKLQMCICRLNCNNFASICSSEFTVLVDVTSERSCHIPAVREDDISSLYQFTITSANTQPIDRGEYISLDLICCMFVASVSVTQFTVWEPIGLSAD